MDEISLMRRYLDSLRSSVLWKAEGLSEWQLRWPLTPSGSNILGLIQHLTMIEYGYLGLVFGRTPEMPDWFAEVMREDAEPNAEMWVSAEVSSEEVVRLYRDAVSFANETIAATRLDDMGRVPWWHEPELTLRQVLVHVVVEVARHVGHLDILREGLDGRIGLSEKNLNLPPSDEHSRADFCDELRDLAIGLAWPGAVRGEYGFPGPMRDTLVAPIVRGHKTATSSLCAAYRGLGEPLPSIGSREVVLDSRGLPVAVVETTDVRTVRFADVDLTHVRAEGEGFESVEAWRVAHRAFWESEESRAELDVPDFRVEDDTPVVLQNIQVVERIGLGNVHVR